MFPDHSSVIMVVTLMASDSLRKTVGLTFNLRSWVNSTMALQGRDLMVIIIQVQALA